MRILCTNLTLERRAGSESYLQTVVPELRALGHRVELFAPRCGSMAAWFRSAGFEVHDDVEDLRGDYDVVHAQHASTALGVRARLRDVPMVFVSHSWFLSIEDPPPEIAPAALVALNDRVAARLRASVVGETVPLHRLTQPVTVTADPGRVPIQRRPTRAALVARDMPTRLEPLRALCDAAGIELEVVGPGDDEVDDPEPAMMRADIVFGSGRTVVEAMALARAVCVYAETGVGGWLTAESYGRLEGAGFVPTGEEEPRPEALLVGYDRMLGTIARDLAVTRHAAAAHAAALVDIYRAAAPRWEPRPAAELERLAELSEALFLARLAARDAQWQAAATHRRNDRLQRELDALWRSASWRLTRPLRLLRRRTPHPDDDAG